MPKSKSTPQPLFTARDLRIGHILGYRKDESPIVVKALNELCVERMTPHVHTVTNEGPECYSFSARVKTFGKVRL